MRAGTAFVLTLILLLAIGIAIDAWATRSAEEQLAGHAAAMLDAEDAEVRLTGWPVSLRLIAGRVPEVEIRARNVHVASEGPLLVVLEVALREVLLDYTSLDAGPASIRGARGEFVADVSEESVTRLAGVPVTFGDGLGQVAGNADAVEVAASVEGGVVVLRPVGSAPEGASPVALALPRLPGGGVVERAQIVPGALRLRGTVRELD
jgi:hypothetical protein